MSLPNVERNPLPITLVTAMTRQNIHRSKTYRLRYLANRVHCFTAVARTISSVFAIASLRTIVINLVESHVPAWESEDVGSA